MRASIRRIDLTTSPATVDVWPSIDWLARSTDETPGATMEDEACAGPRGRGGLWAAMANAVARAREASTADAYGDADVIDLMPDAPHLAYLASVATGTEHDEAEDADVIRFDDRRSRGLD
jgi:hypothetical protein